MNTATARCRDLDETIERLRKEMELLSLEKKELEMTLKKGNLQKAKEDLIRDQETFWKEEKAKQKEFERQRSEQLAQAQVKLAESAQALAERRRKEAENRAALLEHALFYGYVTGADGSVRTGPKPVRSTAGQTVADLIADYHISKDQFAYQVTPKTAHWDRNCPAIKGKKNAHRVKISNCLNANACSKCCRF